MTHKKTGQSGQAIAEFVIALVPIMIAMIAFIYFSAFGVSNIRGLLSSREQTELNAVNGLRSGEAAVIYSWDYGDDVTGVWEPDARASRDVREYIEEEFRGQPTGIPFTADDRPVYGVINSGSGYVSAFSDAEWRSHFNEDEEALSYLEDNENNFIRNMGTGNIFLWAATLSSSWGSDRQNTLDDIYDLAGDSFGVFTRGNVQRLKDQRLQRNIVFMPVINENTTE